MGKRRRPAQRNHHTSTEPSSQPDQQQQPQRENNKKKKATKRHLVEQERTITSDLFVPLVESSTSGGSSSRDAAERLVLQRRLQSVGYQRMAWTHVIYGIPQVDRDAADQQLPFVIDEMRDEKPTTTGRPSMQILRRLHAVVERLSDVGAYSLPTDTSKELWTPQQKRLHHVWNGYDLLSVAPANEACFQAACRQATAVDIVTLDYFSTKGGLPYRIRSSDLQALADRGATLELCYAPAVVHAPLRPKLIQCSREWLTASRAVGSLARILVSSGPRTYSDATMSADTTRSTTNSLVRNHKKDARDLALRTPGDVQNLLHTVLQFPAAVISHQTMSQTARMALEHGWQRRFGTTMLQQVQVVSAGGGAPEEDKYSNHTIRTKPGTTPGSTTASSSSPDRRIDQKESWTDPPQMQTNDDSPRIEDEHGPIRSSSSGNNNNNNNNNKRRNSPAVPAQDSDDESRSVAGDGFISFS